MAALGKKFGTLASISFKTSVSFIDIYIKSTSEEKHRELRPELL